MMKNYLNFTESTDSKLKFQEFLVNFPRAFCLIFFQKVLVLYILK